MADPAHRPLWTVVALLVVAAAALWTSSMLVWTWRVDIAGGTSVVRPVRGAEFQPALTGLALVVLAAVAGVLATSGWLRRGLGALVVVIGAGSLVLAVRGLVEPRTRRVSDAAFERWLDDIDRWSLQSLVGIGLAGLAGVLLALAGVVVLAAGHRMPRMSSRYRQPAARRTPRSSERAIWDELDAGRDPTT